MKKGNMAKGEIIKQTPFYGNSQMAKAMQEHNWNESGLGPVEDWPESLKTSVRLILAAAYPSVILWGWDMNLLYNDAYIPVLGPKHPEALGQSGREKWSEIWDIVGPALENVILEGETSFEEKNLLYMERNGLKEETYYTYSYSPIFKEDGTVGGVFCICHEETLQVLNERRLKTISRIAGISSGGTVDASRTEVMKILSDNNSDIPFALLFEMRDGKAIFNNYTKHAFRDYLEEKPRLRDLGDLISKDGEDLAMKAIPIPSFLRNSLKEPEHGLLPEQVVLIPIKEVGQNSCRTYLVVGISAVLPFNDDYLKFLNLLSSQINATVSNVRAFEQERLLSKKLIELDKAKTDFFSNVSHEFRTPLTLILGPLELLLSKPGNFSNEDRENLQSMYRNGLRLLKQVNTLLNFSYVEAGRYNVTFVPADISSMTYELASSFQTVIKQAGLDYTVKCNTISEPVFVDPEMWEMIILNLISNAHKFTLSGSIEVELTEKAKEVELRVQDTGVGIPQKDLTKIFERFHRVEQNIGRSIEGSGIGLSLVAELIKMHGGGIKVISEVGKGSTFIITIPKGSGHLPQDKIRYEATAKNKSARDKMQYQLNAESWLASGASVLHATKREKEPNARREDKDLPTVLLVDDNLDMLNYVTGLIQDEHDVITARNGQEALEVMQHQIPDLILSDVMMPVMDGVSLLKVLRNTPDYVSIPVILLSARAGADDKFVGFNTGADDYLVKPFSAKELITRIKSNIKNSKLRTAWKEKEQELLSESEKRKSLLETILSSISDAFYHITPDFEFTYVNNKALSITGKKREDHMGKTVLDVYPYIADSSLYQKLTQTVQTLKPDMLEHYDPTLNRWFDCRIYPTASGTSLYFADITDRKVEEQARLETEKKFEEMTNVVPVLIWMSGTDMLCDFFNDHWLEFRGRTHEEEYGFGWAEGVHPDDLDYCVDTYTSSFKERKPFLMEYRLLNKDGEYRWLMDKAVPRFNIDGEFIGYVGACTDITEQKQAESILSNYNNELIKMVEARTEALSSANEQLQSLTSHLQDLRENERKLIAREIHDELGQALTAFKIEISLFNDTIANIKSKHKTTMLENLASIEQALNASFVSMRNIISSLRPSLSDDLELVHEIQKLAADLEKRISIPITIKSEVDSIEMEPNIAIEVYRVVQESVTNVIKHASASSVSIQIAEENNRLRFLVEDDGIGFDETILSQKKSFGILGIRERAQRIGADLAIISSQGNGTKVELLVDATHSKIV